MDTAKVKNLCLAYKESIEKEWDNIQTDNLALCVGAGVTRGFIGNWSELLNELAVLRVCDTLAKQWGSSDSTVDMNELRDYIQSSNGFFPVGMSVLEQGEYLKDDIGDESYPIHDEGDESKWREIFFAEQVRQTIEKLKIQKTKDKSICEYFMENIDNADMATLYAVLRLCLKCDIEQIINYNFDTVLEELLRDDKVCEAILPSQIDIYPNIEVYSYSDKKITGLSNTRRKSKRTIKIYHVHGVAYSDVTHPIQQLVFSEHSYMEYQRVLLNWSHLRIADVLSHKNLICVGFSGTDPNFRFLSRTIITVRRSPFDRNTSPVNLVDIKKIWLTNTYIKSIILDSENGDFKAFACFQTFTESMNRYFLKEFGISILWAKSHIEMADKINCINCKYMSCLNMYR